jgi:hypothetical protein
VIATGHFGREGSRSRSANGQDTGTVRGIERVLGEHELHLVVQLMRHEDC